MKPAMAIPLPPDGLSKRAADEVIWNRHNPQGRRFKVYARSEIRECLNVAFGYRCSYCESFYGDNQPVAIEHYRPKAKVTLSESKEIPGYWWLAADWCNLLPSCTDCNSARKHRTETGTVLMGKANWFPLEDERKRARAEGGEAAEKPLLIHPYHDNPNAHLRYRRDGIVVPRRTRKGEDARGAASIRIYALQRPQLVQQRAWIARVFLNQVDNVFKQARRWEAAPNDAGEETEFRTQVGALKAFLVEGCPYQTMLQQLLKLNGPPVPGGWSKVLKT